MVVIRVQISRDGVLSLISKVRKTVAEGADAFRSTDRARMSEVVAEHNRTKFNKGQRRGGWKRITVGTVVLSRREDWLQSRVGNMGQIKRAANSIEPLEDTGRLKESLTVPGHRNFRVRQSKTRLTFSTNVRYASRHTLGKLSTHNFGPTQKGRLTQRVPPPKGGVSQKGGRRLRGTSKRSKKQGLRPFYRLRTWARKRYPKTTKTPIRSWQGETSPTIVKRIEDVVVRGVVSRMLRPGPVFRSGAAEFKAEL